MTNTGLAFADLLITILTTKALYHPSYTTSAKQVAITQDIRLFSTTMHSSMRLFIKAQRNVNLENLTRRGNLPRSSAQRVVGVQMFLLKTARPAGMDGARRAPLALENVTLINCLRDLRDEGCRWYIEVRKHKPVCCLEKKDFE